MTPLRLVVITSRFWPLAGGAVSSVTQLAVALQEQGVATRIVTPQWARQWPVELVYRGLPVVRLPHPGRGAWGGMRYMLALSRWLRAERGGLDAVYVDGLRYEAYATLGALRHTGVPVVLRARGLAEEGDVAWQQQAAFGSRVRRRCAAAAAIVASTVWAQQELQAAEYPADRIQVIPPGVPLGAAHESRLRAAARATMSDANFDLTAPPTAQVAVFAGRLDRNRGLFELIDAWTRVIRRFPEARLWLVGDGPLREALYQHISDLDLRTYVFLPGTFDELDVVLQAADLFVTASPRPGVPVALLEALAHGLPCVASDTPGHRLLITDEVHGLLPPVGRPEALAQAVIRMFSMPEKAALYGQRARQRMAESYGLERTTRAHLELLERVTKMRK